ncbi:MAG TPA: hypothetical protein VF124_06875 [Gaiellaceae bacterium]
MFRCAAIVAAAIATAALAAVALAAQSPRELRAAIFATAKKQHSLHYVERDSAAGLHQTMVSDIAGQRGVQRVSFTLSGNGRTAKGQFTVRVVEPQVYFRADKVAMQDYLGFTASQAAAYHDKWIVVPRGQHLHKALATAVTMSSFLHEIYPSAPLALANTSIGGRRYTGVRGTNDTEGGGFKFVETVFPDSKMRPFAVSAVDRNKGFISAVKISRWNQAVRVTAPAGAVPLRSVQTV